MLFRSPVPNRQADGYALFSHAYRQKNPERDLLMPVILHAHPTGPLRDSLDGMWSNFEQRGRPTSAQQWLPHVTVTNSLRLSSGEKAELTNSEIENLA